MAKLIKLNTEYWPLGGIGHWCPACNTMHEFYVERPTSQGDRWAFDGNTQSPSFSPSMNIGINPPGHQHYQPHLPSERCHYYLQGGVIKYLSDCTHAFAGKEVPLPDFPADKCISCERL